jgi:hypothetical protein
LITLANDGQRRGSCHHAQQVIQVQPAAPAKHAAAACFDIGRVLKAVILIVEDVMFIREIAEGMIQDWGRNESSGLRSIQTIGGGK